MPKKYNHWPQNQEWQVGRNKPSHNRGQEVIKESIAVGRWIEVLKLDAVMNDHLVPRGMMRFSELLAAEIHPELSEFSPLQR